MLTSRPYFTTTITLSTFSFSLNSKLRSLYVESVSIALVSSLLSFYRRTVSPGLKASRDHVSSQKVSLEVSLLRLYRQAYVRPI